MNPVKRYLEARKVNDAIRAELSKDDSDNYDLAKAAPFPEHLRPATALDVQPGNILYYLVGEGSYWQIVDEVLRPSDAYKAYVAEDGCRYGLEDAFVEIPTKAKKKEQPKPYTGLPHERTVWVGPDWEGVEKEFTITASGKDWIWMIAKGYNIDIRCKLYRFDAEFKHKEGATPIEYLR